MLLLYALNERNETCFWKFQLFCFCIYFEIFVASIFLQSLVITTESAITEFDYSYGYSGYYNRR